MNDTPYQRKAKVKEIDRHLKIIRMVIGKAIKSKSAVFTSEDKADMGAALGWLETFPFYLVDKTEEGLDQLMREYETECKLRDLFRMTEIATEARWKFEEAKRIGEFRDFNKEASVQTAKAAGMSHPKTKLRYKAFLALKSRRKDHERAAKVREKGYHLAKDSAEGRLNAVMGG
jgi:hypothetical protein